MYPYYHGATRPRLIWSLDHIGFGNDQHGPGFYFTDDQATALKYAAPNKEKPDPDYPDGGYLHTCKLLLDDEVYGNIAPLVEDEWERKYAHLIRKMIKQSPNYSANMCDWGEVPHKALELAVNAALKNADGPFESILNVWGDHYMRSGHSKQWAENVAEFFGWDGVLLDPAEKDGQQHVVVWNPGSIVCESKTLYTDLI